MVTLVKTVLYGDQKNAEQYSAALNALRVGMMGEEAPLEQHQSPEGYPSTPAGALAYESKQSLISKEFEMAEEVSRQFPDVVANVMIINQDMSEAFCRLYKGGESLHGVLAELEGEAFLEVWGDDFSDTRIIEELEWGASEEIPRALQSPAPSVDAGSVDP